MTLAITLVLVLLVSAPICWRQWRDNVRDERARARRILDELGPLSAGRREVRR